MWFGVLLSSLMFLSEKNVLKIWLFCVSLCVVFVNLSQWGRQRRSSHWQLWGRFGGKQSATSVAWRKTTSACTRVRGLPCKSPNTHLNEHVWKSHPLCLFSLSLLRYNTNLTRYKNLLFSHSQQLQAKLAFFKTSIQQDLEQYTKQSQSGICECLFTPSFRMQFPFWDVCRWFSCFSFREVTEDLAGKSREGWWVYEGGARRSHSPHCKLTCRL